MDHSRRIFLFSPHAMPKKLMQAPKKTCPFDNPAYFEISDPATGRPLPDGQIGEVVFTKLTRRAGPLIRYRAGDLASLIPEPRPRGSVLRRVSLRGDALATTCGSAARAGFSCRIWMSLFSPSLT